MMSGHQPTSTPWVWDDLRPSTEAAVGGAEPAEAEGSTVDEQLDEAYQAGFSEGRKAGEADAVMAMKQAVDAAVAAGEAVEAYKGELVATLEENTVALAVGIARELIGAALDRSPEVVAELVREAVSEFALDEPLRIMLNPTDLALITGSDELPVAGTRDVRWVPDPKVGRGGCLVEGPGKIVDGRLDLALERVYRAVTGE